MGFIVFFFECGFESGNETDKDHGPKILLLASALSLLFLVPLPASIACKSLDKVECM